MASRKKAATVRVDTTSQASVQARKAGAVWNGWTPELREQARTLAAAQCTHKHDSAYPACFGCTIRTKAYVRFVNGGPSSAEVKAKKAEKAALEPAVAAAPVSAPESAIAPEPVAARIGFRPRGKAQAKVATPPLAEPGVAASGGLQGLAGLSEAELRSGIESLVAEARRRKLV